MRELCEERKAVTVIPLRSFVEGGLAIGIVPRGDRAGSLAIRGAAEAVGMGLDPTLSPAEVLQ